MGFFKDLKRDFAQAVNELMPESDSSNNKKTDHSETEGVIENLDSHPAPDNPDAISSDVPEVAAPGDAALSGQVQDAEEQLNDSADAISEAVLRKEAERLRQEIGKNIDTLMFSTKKSEEK